MKEYGLRLVNKASGKVERDWDFTATTEEARIHFVRQSHSGEFTVEYREREREKTEQPSQEDRLDAELYFLEKQADHAAKAYGVARTQKDRDIAKDLLDSLAQKITDLRAQIKALKSSK